MLVRLEAYAVPVLRCSKIPIRVTFYNVSELCPRLWHVYIRHMIGDAT